MTALANVGRARKLLDESNYKEREWVAVGTASLPRTIRTVFGR